MALRQSTRSRSTWWRGRWLNHYRMAVGHIPARLALEHGLSVGDLNTNPEWAKEGTKLTEWTHAPIAPPDAGRDS